VCALSSDVLFCYRICFAKLWRLYTAKDKLEETSFSGAAKVVSSKYSGRRKTIIRGESKYIVRVAF
jgi:hypothetical protein